MALRIALVGAGWAAQAVHGPSLVDYAKRRGGIRLEAVCDLDAAKVDEVRRRFGFKQAFTSLDDLLRQADALGALIVAVSINHNAAVARVCLRARLPMLLEKPPALTQRDVATLDRAVRAARVPAMVAFNRRFAPALVELRRAALQAGPIQSLRADMWRTARRDPDFSTTAVHVVDALRFLAGADYERLGIDYGRCGPKGAAASYHVAGRMAGGIPVAFDVVPQAGADLERYTLRAGGRTFIGEIGFSKSADALLECTGGERRAIPFRTPSPSRHDAGGYYGEVAAFLDGVKALKAGRLRRADFPGPSLAETVQTVAVMEALSRGRKRYQRRKD